MALLNTFANNLLPILLLGGAGFALGKFLVVEPQTLGRAVFYIFAPLLVFNLIVQSQLSLGSLAEMVAFAAGVMLIGGGLAYLAGRVLHLDRTPLIAVVLTTMFANNGNYGLPLIAFAFGSNALAYASVYYATLSLLFYTVGVMIASLDHLQPTKALSGLIKVPAIYAILLAVVFNRIGWQLPPPLERTVSLAADATVPAMLVLLGLELTRAKWTGNLRALSIPVAGRLIVGPLLGWGLTALFGMKGPARQDGITDAGMPSAVMTTMLATEYGLEPALVTTIVFVSTILSPLTLTPLLYFLGK
ncbi:MAG: AEC family transporter [Anaerolineales bacterium]|jgi:predicted permease